MRCLKHLTLLAVLACSVIHAEAQVQDGPSYYNNPQNGSPVQDGPSYYNPRSGYPVQDGPSYYNAQSGRQPVLDGPSYYPNSQNTFSIPNLPDNYTLCDYYPDYPPACFDQAQQAYQAPNYNAPRRRGGVFLAKGPSSYVSPMYYRRNFPAGAVVRRGNTGAPNTGYRGGSPALRPRSGFQAGSSIGGGGIGGSGVHGGGGVRGGSAVSGSSGGRH